MSQAPTVLLTAVLLLGCTVAGASETPKDGAPAHHIPGRALIKLKATTRSGGAIVDVAALKGVAVRTGLDLTLVKRSVLGWLVVDVKVRGDGSVPTEDDTLKLVDRLAHDDAVAAATENQWARAFATPNDPSFSQMWHLTVPNLPAAWDDEQGSTAQRVGIVDTGLVRNHEDVGSKAVVGFDFISNAQTAGDGSGRDADFEDVGDACNGSSSSFHGTHVAGTVAANTNNGVGIAGVNWNARLAIVRALGRCGGDIVDIMEGALWLAGGSVAGVTAIGADRVSVINLSLGSPGACSAFQQDTVNAIDAAGVVFVAAAGNDRGAVNSPANCNNVVAVAAHGPTRALSPYSSFGPQVDVVGPGGDFSNFGNAGGVLSTLGPSSNGYALYEGTSMAAPHVTGVISLMQAKDPSVNRARAEQVLQQSGQSCTNCSGKLALDAAAALALLTRGGPVTPPDPPVDPVDPGDPAVDDAFEENDTAPASARVRCGDTHNLKALARDQDWFFVDVDAGPLALSIDGGQTDLDLYIVRNDTEILLRSESGTGVEALTADVTRNQRLQILVNPFADATTAASGPYTLTLTCTAAADTPPPDPTEPDPVDPTPDPVDPVGEGEGEGGSGEGEGEGEGAALNGQLVAPLAAGGCSAGASSDAIAPVALGVFLMARRRRHT